jgi:uncharacterized protein (TIGR02246 family)
MTTSAEAPIVELLERLTGAWNAGDAATFGSLFTEDADYITFFGANMPGRKAIEEGHRMLFEGPLKGSTLSGGGGRPKIRFVRPDVAIVVAGGGSSLEGGDKPDPGRESVLTYVVVREDDGWRFASFQNTRVSDPRAGA